MINRLTLFLFLFVCTNVSSQNPQTIEAQFNSPTIHPLASTNMYSSADAVGIDQAVKANGGGNPPAATPPEFVLIHGYGCGAWCWYKVKCFVENTYGYKVTCLDLASAGMDLTKAEDVHTFQQYNKPLIDYLSSLPHNHQVILVGHSAGGLSLSDAINRFGSKKIKVAVFVAATMLKSGFATAEDRKIGYPAGKENLTQVKLPYPLCQDNALWTLLRRLAPLNALKSAKFKKSREDVDKVLRIYIKTTRDRVVEPWQQEAMIEKWPPADVYKIDSDHNPNIFAPVQLSKLLHRVALTYGYN